MVAVGCLVVVVVVVVVVRINAKQGTVRSQVAVYHSDAALFDDLLADDLEPGGYELERRRYMQGQRRHIQTGERKLCGHCDAKLEGFSSYSIR